MRLLYTVVLLIAILTAPILTACSSAPATPPLQAQRLARYTARVVVRCPDRGESHMGSGVIVSPDGLVLTAYHVVRAVEEDSTCTIGIGVANRLKKPVPLTYRAVLVDRDPVMDVAVLRITADKAGRPLAKPLSYAPLASSPPAAGETVHILGFPQITDDILAYDSDTVISEGDCASADTCWLLTEAFASWGSSGGPVFDDRGRLVGITLGQRTMALQGAQHRLTTVRPIQALVPLVRTAMLTPVPLQAVSTPTPEPPKMDQWRVEVIGPRGVNWRREPSTQAGTKSIIEVLPKGTVLHVIPPGKWQGWWATADSHGRMGWIKESTDTTPLVRAFFSTVTSRIAVNAPAVITCLTQAPCAHLRYTPGYERGDESGIVGSLPGGTRVHVLEGPYRVEGLVWWHVQGDGMDGWLPEVTDGGYRLLAPLPAINSTSEDDTQSP